jgi:hypothetical protein
MQRKMPPIGDTDSVAPICSMPFGRAELMSHEHPPILWKSQKGSHAIGRGVVPVPVECVTTVITSMSSIKSISGLSHWQALSYSSEVYYIETYERAGSVEAEPGLRGSWGPGTTLGTGRASGSGDVPIIGVFAFWSLRSVNSASPPS